jgi:transcriptional regulator with XRE-family HTH domain
MPVRGTEHGIASSNHLAFLVRRARLLLGLTQSEFAEHFDVETSTVSRWERGLVKPMPKARAAIARIAAKAAPLHSTDLIRATPVFKYLARRGDLYTPLVVSRGFTVYLEEIGCTLDDFLNGQAAIWTQPDEPGYKRSVAYCVTQIEQDPRWLRGEIAYAEFRGFAKTARQWSAGLAVPLPDEPDTALVEAIKTIREGYYLKLVPVSS